ALKKVVDAYKADGKPFNMGMVFPLSTHNYELRYWLASGGLNPGFYSPSDISGQILADVLLSVTPPPQMPATLEAGTILGYCVGEPWNQQAMFKGIGVPVITDYEIWKNNPEKVFGFSGTFASKNPNTVLATTKALIRAGMWLDENNNANRETAVHILAKPEYVGADAKVIANSMTGTFEYEKGDKRDIPDFNVFFRYFATYPFYSDAIWYLTQMRRWGQIAQAKPDAWYADTAKSVYRPDLYLEAAKLLIADGRARTADFPWDSDGYRPPTAEFIDAVTYDGRKPNAYLESLAIGLKNTQHLDGFKVVSN
ncbi:MAG: ABC transporter substrate-binding protein, partial [Proteobacteria bacterium]|nr:ABC transporter substrate-binding protein [Pseudomonadota bacterium]